MRHPYRRRGPLLLERSPGAFRGISRLLAASRLRRRGRQSSFGLARAPWVLDPFSLNLPDRRRRSTRRSDEGTSGHGSKDWTRQCVGGSADARTNAGGSHALRGRPGRRNLGPGSFSFFSASFGHQLGQNTDDSDGHHSEDRHGLGHRFRPHAVPLFRRPGRQSDVHRSVRQAVAAVAGAQGVTHLKAAHGGKGFSVARVQGGRLEVFFHHEALYTFVSDAKKGQARGQGVENEWFAVLSNGKSSSKSVTATSPAAAGATTTMPPTSTPSSILATSPATQAPTTQPTQPTQPTTTTTSAPPGGGFGF